MNITYDYLQKQKAMHEAVESEKHLCSQEFYLKTWRY